MGLFSMCIWISRASLKTGTIVDASIIDAPSSTKNRRGERDPEMHQMKKGNQWYFGMKAHIGVDAESGLAHSLATTAANAADVTQFDGGGYPRGSASPGRFSLLWISGWLHGPPGRRNDVMVGQRTGLYRTRIPLRK